MAKKRYREKFAFWLNLNNDQEYALAELIQELKQKRLFAKAIRDGLRLICDLRADNLDVLFELFPWVKTELEKKNTPDSPGDELKAIREQIEKLQQVTIQQNAPSGYLMAAREAVAATPADLPSMFVKADSVTHVTSTNARGEFAGGLGDLFGDDDDDLWD